MRRCEVCMECPHATVMYYHAGLLAFVCGFCAKSWEACQLTKTVWAARRARRFERARGRRK